MAFSQAIALLVVTIFVIALTVLALVMLSLARLESGIGILRDGIPVDSLAPAWRLPDLIGIERRVPSGSAPQLLLFADHSLREFPDVVASLRELRVTASELEVLLLARRPPEVVELTVGALGLGSVVSAVPCDDALYNLFNVRVMPFAHFLDPDGRVTAAGLVNRGEQLLHLWRLAQLHAHVVKPEFNHGAGAHGWT